MMAPQKNENVLDVDLQPARVRPPEKVQRDRIRGKAPAAIYIVRAAQRGEGFTPPNRVEYNEVNLFQLSKFTADSEVGVESLAEARLLSKSGNPVAILGNGNVTVPLKLRVHRITRSAREKIEAAGGTVELIIDEAE